MSVHAPVVKARHQKVASCAPLAASGKPRQRRKIARGRNRRLGLSHQAAMALWISP